MAQHQMPKKHKARRAVLAGVAAAGLSSALVAGTTTDTTVHRDVTLANTVIGIGGRDDGNAMKLKDKLDGKPALGFVGAPVSIEYPANILFQSSIDVGAPKLRQAITDAGPNGKIRVVSYSEGTLVAEKVKRDLAAETTPLPPGSIDFVFIASPYSPNGGLFARFPGFQIPGLLPAFSAAQPSKYESTFITNEYDGFADFPAYFNPLSLTNALLGMVYAHPDEYYNGIKLDSLQEGTGKFTTYVPKVGAEGRDTYVLVYNPHLPLFAPLRQLAGLTLLTPLTEPLLSAIEPLVRVVVDMGYTDRTNANPAKPTPFSLVTPPQKIVEAVTGAPAAIEQGATNARSGGQPSAPPTDPGITTGSQNRQMLKSIPNDDQLEQKDPNPDPSKQTDTKLPERKLPPTGPFAAIAKALKAFGVHPTVTSDGNKVAPTTTAGPSTSVVGGDSTPDTTKVDATTPSSPAADGQAAA